MTNCPVSVVIPCRNYGQFLGEALESVLRQESLDDSAEVIVVNDHSSDSKTLQSLAYWEKADPRIRVIHNRGRAGQASARNLGIAEASGEWIAFLDADDIWLPAALRNRWRVLQTYPEAQWIGADFLRQHEDGTCDTEGSFKSRSSEHQMLHRAYESGDILKLQKPVAEFLRMSLGWTSTIMAKRNLLLSVGGFEPSLGNYEDHHLWIRLARQTDFYFVPEVVTRYRDHARSVSRKEGPPAYWYIVAMRLLQKDPLFRPYRTLIRWKLTSLFEQNISYHRARGETSLAIRAAVHALVYQPMRIQSWRALIASIAGHK